MQSVKVKSYAKLNLSLDIVGAENGYHMLDSFVCSIDIHDTLIAKKRGDKLINVYMRGLGSENIPPEKNNAAKAGEKFVSVFGVNGADITILKDIPMGAGLGGSSADAAGVINAMGKLYGIGDKLKQKELADSLGSDTGYMLTGGYARLRGRGEKVDFFSGERELNFLLILPPTGVSTPLCYKKYDEAETAYSPVAEKMISAYNSFSPSTMGSLFKNDLTAAACDINPCVAEALVQAKDFSPLGYGMSGSGSGVFALFENSEMCLWAQSRYKGKFKTRVVKTVIPRKEEKTKRIYSPFALTEEEKRLK